MKGLFRENRLFSAVLAAMLLAYLGAICLINLSGTPSFYDADMYCDYQYAVKTWEGKSIFPENWIFGNQLNAVSTPVLAALLYGLSGNANGSMGLACMLMAALVLWSFDWMIAPVLKSRDSRLLAALVFMASALYFGSAVTGNAGWTLFFTMCSYYAGYSTTAFLAFGSYLRSLKGYSRSGWWILGLTCLFSFGTGIQSIRQTVVMIAPMAAVEAVRILYCRIKKQPVEKLPLLAVSAMGLSNLLGLVFVRFVPIHQVEIFGGIALTELSGYPEAVSKCVLMVLSLLTNGTRLCYLLLGLLLLACGGGLVTLAGKKEGRVQWQAAVPVALMGISAAAIVGIDILTTMYVRPRYYFMIYPLMALLAALLYDRRGKGVRAALVVVAALLFGMSWVQELSGVCTQALNRREEESYAISRYLTDNGYDTVYSVWGHGEDLAIASDNAIAVGYWDSTDAPFEPMPYLHDPGVYRASPERCVYLFDGEEAVQTAMETAAERQTELAFLAHFPDSDAYLYTAPVNLMTK